MFFFVFFFLWYFFHCCDPATKVFNQSFQVFSREFRLVASTSQEKWEKTRKIDESEAPKAPKIMRKWEPGWEDRSRANHAIFGVKPWCLLLQPIKTLETIAGIKIQHRSQNDDYVQVGVFWMSAKANSYVDVKTKGKFNGLKNRVKEKIKNIKENLR